MINLLGRQYWTDQRLSFNSTVIDELTMNWQVGKITSTYLNILKGGSSVSRVHFSKAHLHVIILHVVILQFLYKIWTPDTYFLNGRDSYLHKIAVPNRSDSLDFFLRLIYEVISRERKFVAQIGWMDKQIPGSYELLQRVGFHILNDSLL